MTPREKIAAIDSHIASALETIRKDVTGHNIYDGETAKTVERLMEMKATRAALVDAMMGAR